MNSIKITKTFLLIGIAISFMVGCTTDHNIKITFDSNGGSIINPREIRGDQTIDTLENPTKNGFVFDGWFWDNQTFLRPFNTNSLLEEPTKNNFTVYAKWIPEEIINTDFHVVFDVQGGSSVTSQTIIFRGLIIKPVNPTKIGYLFGGWYSDTTYNKEWDFSKDKVENNITLYAKWDDLPDSYGIVNFVSKFHDNIPSQQVLKGTGIVAPSILKEGYTLDGWYTSIDNGVTFDEKWSFISSTVNSNLTLYAKWERDVYLVDIVITPPIKTQYLIDDEIDLTGLVVKARYSNQTEVILDSYEYDISSFDSSVSGTKVITIKYSYATAKFNVSVELGEDRANTLIVGVPTTSTFIVDMFGNNQYDIYVQKLIFGYQTVVTTRNGLLAFNPTVVTNYATIHDNVIYHPSRTIGFGENIHQVQDKTYTFEIAQDLTFSDGTPITAHHFIFGLMFKASHEWRLYGPVSSMGEYILGYGTYRPSGEFSSANRYFSGVKLINDYTFAITIDGERPSQYYELSLMNITPMPFHVLASNDFDSNTDIISDELGTKLSSKAFAKMSQIFETGGYRYAPNVVSGPYRFISYQNHSITLLRNSHFKGNYEGKTPSIEIITIKRINPSLDIDLVISGDIDLVVGVVDAIKIDIATNNENTNITYYVRNGFESIAMNCDFGPTADYRVRQAIGLLVDRNEFIDEILGGNGVVINSLYGLSSWMFESTLEQLQTSLINYQLDVEQANLILSMTEWKYESDGITLFDPGKAETLNNGTLSGNTYFRYNSERNVLQINHMGEIDNYMTNLIGAQLPKYFGLAGIEFTIAYAEFNEILNQYYYSYNLKPTPTNPIERRIYHTFNVPFNFNATFDPYFSFHSDYYGTWYNKNQLIDSKIKPAIPLNEGKLSLDELMILMRELQPNQQDEYLVYWLQFVIRWNQLLPSIPIYSNVIYDIYHNRISGVTTTSYWDWTDSINDTIILE